MQSCSARAQSIPWELTELRFRLELLPAADRREVVPLCQSLIRWLQQRQRLVGAAQEAVDQLRLDVRYLRFDLEATRRERDAYKARLEPECP